MAYTYWLLENTILHHFCLTWLYYGIDIYISWMKVLLGNKWNDFCHDTLCFFCLPSSFCAEFFSFSDVTEIFVTNWGKSFWLTLLLRCSLVFLSCTTGTVPADWGAVFDLENSSWLLLYGKLCVIRIIVGDSVFLSLRCETEAGFFIIDCVGWKAFKSKGFRRYYFFWT